MHILSTRALHCDAYAVLLCNREGISQWRDYLNGLKNYISNPVIAWDYANRYHRTKKGAIYLNELGYNAIFMVLTNNQTQQAYVYLFWIDLKPEEFGLKVPPTLNEKNNLLPR